MAATKRKSPLAGIKRQALFKALHEDERVREWLGSDVLMSPKEVCDVLGIERARLWRWEQQTEQGNRRRPIAPVARTVATPLYLRSDVEKLKTIIDADPSSRRKRRTAEPETAAA